MKRNTYFIVIALLVLSVWSYSCDTASSKPKSTIDEARKAIAESNAIYFQAFTKGDSSLFIERYAKDCCIMPPHAPALCGPKAALEFFKIAYHQLGIRNGKFTTTQVYGNSEEFVTEEGLWELFDANGDLFDKGKFLVLWKKTAEGWKMYRDSFSSNLSR